MTELASCLLFLEDLTTACLDWYGQWVLLFATIGYLLGISSVPGSPHLMHSAEAGMDGRRCGESGDDEHDRFCRSFPSYYVHCKYMLAQVLSGYWCVFSIGLCSTPWVMYAWISNNIWYHRVFT